MAGNLSLSHAGIMFERHGGDRLAGLRAPADSRESDDSADIRTPAREEGGFRLSIEVRGLQPYDRGHVILPSLGGKTRPPWRPRSTHRPSHGRGRWRHGSPWGLQTQTHIPR